MACGIIRNATHPEKELTVLCAGGVVPGHDHIAWAIKDSAAARSLEQWTITAARDRVTYYVYTNCYSATTI